MFNPLKFVQSVKQEAFKVTWPTGRDVLIGSLMVFALAALAAIFFLLIDQVFKFLLDLILAINIWYEKLVYSADIFWFRT